MIGRLPDTFPPVAVELVRAMVGNDEEPLPDKITASLGPTDLSDVVPVTFLADSVVVVSDAGTGEPLLAIIVEPQGRDNPTKKFSWPVYLTVARRILKCPRTFLLVICPDSVEAEKCREVIRTGHPGFDLVPAVIDPRNTPGIGDASPYLTLFAACMGAIDMAAEDGARHVLAAINDTGAPDADLNRLTAIILNLASNAARQTLEALMTATEWTTHPFIESFKKEGIAAGLVKAKAEDVIKIIDARGIEVTEEQRKEIDDCTDLVQLDHWFDRALTAKTAADIFQG